MGTSESQGDACLPPGAQATSRPAPPPIPHCPGQNKRPAKPQLRLHPSPKCRLLGRQSEPRPSSRVNAVFQSLDSTAAPAVHVCLVTGFQRPGPIEKGWHVQARYSAFPGCSPSPGAEPVPHLISGSLAPLQRCRVVAPELGPVCFVCSHQASPPIQFHILGGIPGLFRNNNP